jgi:hypothetical protein
MPLYTFLHNLLNVLAQIANQMGLQKKIKFSGAIKLGRGGGGGWYNIMHK